LAGALSNVLLNAVDACAGGGAITVSATRGMLAGKDAVQLTVSDTGCGMTPQVLETIWEPYVTHKAGGTGLGLAIARQAVTAHGGVVHAQSEPGRGTTVSFLLPLSA
jgi:signal transduction histidine kinase